jgi:hypothetical protein
MFTMRPVPRGPATCAKACAQKNAARRLTAMKRSNAAGVVRRNGVRAKIAALFTSTSSRPRRRAAPATSARASAGRARSARSATARTPSASRSRTVARASRADCR